MRLEMNFFILCFSLAAGTLVAQDFSPEGSKRQMQSLTVEQKVKFINEHFYKLYSADFDNAVSLSKWAAETAHTKGWPTDEARAQLGWGVILFLSGKYTEVLPHYFRSRDLYDSLNNKKGLAEIHNEMAVFYHKQKDFKNAWAALDTSEKLAREINDIETLGTSLDHRGSMLAAQGKFAEAKTYYLKVYDIRVKTRDSVGLGYALNNLSEAALKDGRLEESLRYLDLSTEIRTRLGDKQGVAINFVNKGENYFQTGQFAQAAQSLEEGLRQSMAIGFDDLSRHTYEYLGKTYLALKDYRKAYELQEKSISFKDNLYNIEKSRVIQELQTKYDTEKKDREISDLNKDNQLKAATIERNYFLMGGLLALLLLGAALFYVWRLRSERHRQLVLTEQKIRIREAQINAVIESQEQERKRFASDLHDGMGQLVSALQLTVQSIKSTRDQEKTISLVENSEQLLTDIQSEIRNIAFNLMPPILMKEGLVPATKELIRRVNQASKLKSEVAAHEVANRLPDLIEISLYRIIQELVSNIIKHSKATYLTLSFTGYAEEIVLTIEDDGMGYDLTSFQNSKQSNGWRTIQTRMQLVKGQIDFDTMVGRRNNTVTIQVPLKVAQENVLIEI
jgi:two-component system, NarL family, sensor kinase